MPFTFSHPAAVLPFRRYGVLSALVVGSIAPDLLYFIPGVQKNSYGHTLPGLFMFCLPAGLLVLWIFHAVVKRPLISLFPVAHQQKLLAAAGDFSFLPLQRFIQIAVSILLGAATHIAWDSFTHPEGWAVRHVGVLRIPIPFTPNDGFLLFDLLQHLSTITGGALIMYYYFRWLQSAPRRELVAAHQFSPRLRFLFLLVSAAGTLMPALYRFLQHPDFWLRHERRDFLGSSVIGGLKVLCLEIVLFSIFWHFVSPKRQLERD